MRMTKQTDWEAHDQTVTSCRICPRLVAWREQVAREKRRAYKDCDYWGKPVPGFGDTAARVLVVGLAPGAHGSNRTGRMFTGDASGDFLYPALHTAGFASQPLAESREDDLKLKDLYISAVCRCAPPDNKPTREEIRNCLPLTYRQRWSFWGTCRALWRWAVWRSRKVCVYCRRAIRWNGRRSLHLGITCSTALARVPWLLGSYHPSRQNTQTGRLTMEMFNGVWEQARAELGE